VKRGLARAAALLTGIENGISGWLLALKLWLKDPESIKSSGWGRWGEFERKVFIS